MSDIDSTAWSGQDVGAWLTRETQRALNAGPLPAMNPRQKPQTEGYELSAIRAMEDQEAEIATKQFKMRQEAAAKLVRSGAADPAVPVNKR